MPPDQLAADVPIPHIFHPVTVGVDEFFRHQVDFLIEDSIKGRLCQFLHFQKPLVTELWFYYRSGTFTGPNLIQVIFGFNQDPFFFQFFYDRFSGLKPIHALVLHSVGIKAGIIMKNINNFQVMFISQNLVILIMSRGHFQTSRSKFHVNILIFNDRYHAVT